MPIDKIVESILEDAPVRTLRAEFAGPSLTGVDIRHPFKPETVIALVYSRVHGVGDDVGLLHVPREMRVESDWVRVKLATAGGFDGWMVVHGVPKD